MNSIAVKAFLRGAMQEDPSDEQIEDLIAFLQGHIKTNNLSKDILDRVRWGNSQVPYEDVEELKMSFENELSMDYLGYDFTTIKWNWIYEQLKAT